MNIVEGILCTGNKNQLVNNLFIRNERKSVLRLFQRIVRLYWYSNPWGNEM